MADVSHIISAIERYVSKGVPTGCWGSREAYQEWIKLGGMEGIRRGSVSASEAIT